MNLYLFRHGKAARQDPDGPSILTPKGSEEVSKVAGYFKKRGLKIQTLWHSPKERAVQTAEIFLGILGGQGILVEEKKFLEPDGDAQDVLQQVNNHISGDLLIVSHLPLIGELGALLAVDSTGADTAFPTAGMAAFVKKNNIWQWLWSVGPDSIR